MAKLLKDETLISAWQDFLENDYKSQIEDIALAYPEKRSLEVDYDVLDKKNPDLANKLLESPYESLFNAELSVKKIDTATDRHINLHIRIINLPDICKIPIRNIRSEHIGKLISIEGLVKKHTAIRADTKIGCFQCQKCGAIIKTEQNEDILKEPSECLEDQGGCGRAAHFKFISTLSTFIDGQKLLLEETSEGLRAGAQPTKTTIFLEDDIVGKLFPGDRVCINGILRGIERRRGATQLSSFDFGLNARSIEISESLYEEIKITDEEKKEIIKTSKDPLLYEKMKNSIAPAIYGMDTEKMALLLQLFGGVLKPLPGMNIRGDIHMLLVGDPGTAKSQLLSRVSKISPRSVFCTGKGASAAGLTAAVVRDDFGEGNWSLEAGALVLADMGIACIDEIDKMEKSDREALHPAMEQQWVDISKAGINARLHARCSVLAAANPKLGRFDDCIPIHEQIDMPVTLLSRFDLIFSISDKPNKKTDEALASHILNLHQNPDSKDINPTFSPSFLLKYVTYAKQNIKPKITNKVHEKIKSFYVELRADSEDSIAITPRQLEAIIRLAEASAKVRLSKEVSEEDADRAISIFKEYLNRVGMDRETGKYDIDIVMTGTSHSQFERMQSIIGIIKQESAKSTDGNALKEDIIKEAEIIGIESGKVESALEHLKRDGHIFEPVKEKYRVIK